MHPALGIDYGEARIGVAATDPLGILAHPVETIHIARTAPLPRIAELVNSRQIKTLVLGIPIRFDGEEGSAAAKIRQFGNSLSTLLPDIPLVYIDEYMTTVAASEKLREAGKNSKKQRPLIDQAAAVEILKLWMEQNDPNGQG